MRHFKKGKIGENLQKHRERRNIKTIRGKRVDLRDEGDSRSVQSAIGAKRLRKQNIIPRQNREQNDDMLALTALSAIGVSIETSHPYNRNDYSMLEDQTDTELFENENIFDPTQFKVISKATGLADKFPNVANPIFQPDESLISSRQKANKALKDAKVTPSVVSVAGAISAANISSVGSTLKQFK